MYSLIAATFRDEEDGRRNRGDIVVEKCSVYEDGQRQIDLYKWLASERAGYDLGETAIRHWVRVHWHGYLRERWIEHLQGERFWVELDRGDFGLMRVRFQEQILLMDRILDRLKAGQENLNIINWALDWGIDTSQVRDILEALDINSRRLVHKFEP